MAGRKPLKLLPLDLADEFRDQLTHRLERRGIQRRALLRKFPGWGDRSRRWLDAALSPGQPLAINTAYELMDRAHRLKVRLSDRIFRRLYADRLPPVAFIFPGHGKQLAEVLANEASRLPGVSEKSRKSLETRFAQIFDGYEKLNVTPFGESILEFILSQIGGDEDTFRIAMAQLRSPRRVRGQYTLVDSVPRYLANDFLKKFSPRRKRTRSKV